jgi:hypothetical protein
LTPDDSSVRASTFRHLAHVHAGHPDSRALLDRRRVLEHGIELERACEGNVLGEREEDQDGEHDERDQANLEGRQSARGTSRSHG